jgi:hypothetical protein
MAKGHVRDIMAGRPSILRKLLNDSDPAKSKRIMNAMLKMNKIVINDPEKIYNQE